ncbi:YybH family protein [Nonomuraea endophytica]|uniref:YybH family protein n=1 Tax=Nonomuraea endophytica TaxID=714136 RepID=UPI0037CA57E2
MSDDERRVRELHDGWVTANGSGDVDWLRAHLAGDDFVMWNTLGSNFFGLDGIVELWKQLIAMAGEAVPQRVVSQAWDERITVGGELAVVSYLCRLTVDFGPRGEEAGGNLDRRYRATEVYQRRDGDWKMVHYHGSPHQPGVMGGS